MRIYQCDECGRIFGTGVTHNGYIIQKDAPVADYWCKFRVHIRVEPQGVNVPNYVDICQNCLKRILKKDIFK